MEGVLYSAHRYFFERDSSSFAGQGLSKQEPMVLANISVHDFDLLLSILYPTYVLPRYYSCGVDLTTYAHSSFGAYPASTVEEWSGILHLADKWSFLSIRALAIAQIAPIACPIDKIVFGRLYGVNEWLTGAYHAVCTRPDALTLEEGRRLGVDDVIRINTIRQEFCFVRVSKSSSTLLQEDVESRFGLAIQTEDPARRKSMQDVLDKLEAESKKEQEAKAAEIERQTAERQEAEKRRKEEKLVKDLEAKKAQEQREAEEAVMAAEIERKNKEREAADKKAKEDRKAKGPMKKDKKGTGKIKPEAAMNGISNTSTGAAANKEEDWSHLDPLTRYCKKAAKIKQERDEEERAELVKQMKQQLADEAKAAGGGVSGDTSDISDGASGVSLELNSMSGVSNTSMGTTTSDRDDWSHLTPSERYYEKMTKINSERLDEEHAAKSAQLLKEAKQQIADEAKAAEEAAAQQGAGSTCGACCGGPDPHVCA